MTDRSVEEIIRELERTSRRARPFLIGGLFIVFVSLIGSVVYLNMLYREAAANERTAREELSKFQATSDIITRARNASSAQERIRILDEGLFGIAQVEAPQRPPQIALSALRIDLFLCEGGRSDNRSWAEELRVRLRGQAGSVPQPRLLSAAINATEIYRATGIQIRYNPNEENAADRLAQLLRETSGIEARKILTFYPTQGRLSVFFCEGVNLAPAETSVDAAGNVAGR